MAHIPHYHGAFSVCAVLSITASASVVLTLLLFEQMRNKLFMRFIAFMALGDIFGNIPYLYTWRYRATSPWCYIGGVLLQTGSVSAWLWTTALCFMWHRASTHSLRGVTWHIMPMFHIVCWGVPIAFCLPSLALSSFENKTTYDGVCSTYGTYSARLYHNIWSYTLLVICMLFMIALYSHLVYLDQDKQSRQSEVSVAYVRNFAAAKSTLVCYPILFVVFWLPKLILTTLYELLSLSNAPFEKTIDIFTCWYMFHGFAVAVVFFYNSPLARSLWRNKIKLFLSKLGLMSGHMEGDDERNESDTRATVADYPNFNNNGDDYSDSMVDYRSTFGDPADCDLRQSASFRERQSSLHRGMALMPHASARPSLAQNNPSLSNNRASNSFASPSSTMPQQNQLTHKTDSASNNITATNLQHQSQSVVLVKNPIMNSFVNNYNAKEDDAPL